ncbi:MAG: hypothetical protein WCQ99_03055 [Pseudomonadota bacterium]
MAKGKKHKPLKSEAPHLLSTEALEEKAHADMLQLNFRRAKDWLKELCKRCRDKYQPLLIECYQKQAHYLLDKGQSIDAQIILGHIRNLTGGAMPPGAQALSPAQTGDYAATAQAYVDRLCSAEAPLAQPERSRAAHALVLAFEGVPLLQARDAHLHQELSAIHHALQNVCARQFSEALDAVRGIGLQSLFAGWKLYIKGLCAFFSEQDLKALDSFKRLEHDPLLSKAAAPYIYILDASARHMKKTEPKELFIKRICAVVNRPDMENILPRAEYLWQTKRYRDSFEHVRRTLAGFPSGKPGLVHALSLFYFNIAFSMTPDQVSHYLEGLSRIIGPAQGKPECLMFERVINLLSEDMPPDEELMELWENYVDNHARVHGEHAGLRAMVYLHVGGLFALEDEPETSREALFSMPKAALRSPRLAEHYYNKSLALRPDSREAQLSLLRVYEATNNKSKANKKLDEIAALFPDDKTILLKNSANCLARKAYSKSLECLRKAVALDPLDRAVKQLLCVACIKASLHYAEKRTPLRYRELMAEAMLLGEPEGNDFSTGHRYLKVRLAIFELLNGCEEKGMPLLEETLRCNAQQFGFVYFSYLIGKKYRLPQQQLKMLEKLACDEMRDPDPGRTVALIAALTYIKAIDSSTAWLPAEYKRIKDYAFAASKKQCPADAAAKIVEWAFSLGYEGRTLREKYIQQALQRDAKDPQFLYFKYREKMYAGSRQPLPRKKDITTLQEILTLARKRNDRRLIAIVDKELKTMEDLLHSFPGSLNNAGYDDFDAPFMNDFFDTLVASFNTAPKKRKQGKKPARTAAKKLFSPDPRHPPEKPGPLQKSLFDFFDAEDKKT